RPEYLVETDWLEQNIDMAELRIFDCSVNVIPNPDPEQGQQIPLVFQSGRINYDQAHIPRAGFIDVPLELSDNSSHLPLMVPSEKQFTETMSQYGIGDDTRVVLYSTTEPNWAARVWWMLRAFGFDRVAILNGGWNKWTTEGRPVSNQSCEYLPSQFIARPRSGFFVGKKEVLEAIDNDEIRTINALPSALHTGNSDIVFGRKGHISGSVNVPFVELHDPDTGSYVPADQLFKIFDSAVVSEASRVITYCGG
ncbi:MAG: sulfurtransferase, partial [Gammaproteobacteria bacterium]